MESKKVTCYGMPFYAGWGVTDDRQSCSRRNRRLTVLEIFAASYLLYPRYFDPISGEPSDFEMVVERLSEATALRNQIAEQWRGCSIAKSGAF
jgi:capsular polysaccharide export protein